MQPTATESSSVPKRYTAPIVFGILELPFGAAVGFLQVAVPFWLAAQGVPLEDIAAISATGFMPHALKIFWVPALDIGNYRRRWYAVMAVGTAAFLFASAAFPDPVHHLGWYTVILTLAQVTASTLSSAVDALMATSAEPAQKGRVGGYKMAGNVGGTALLGVVPIWLARQFTPLVAGVFLAGIVLACAVGIFFVFEHKVVASVGDAVGTFFAKSMRLLRSFAA